MSGPSRPRREAGADDRRGTPVTVGQTLGFVGTTGLSTAPHLHFETLVNGQSRDPRAALQALKGGQPIPNAERAAFEQVRARLIASLDRASGRVSAPTTIAD